MSMSGGWMRGLGGRWLLAVVSVVVVSCGPAAEEPVARTSPSSPGSGREDPMLRAVVDGELGGAATDAFGDRAVVYGGVDAQGEPSDLGFVLRTDGGVERFETGVRFAEPLVALTGDRLVVVGRRCDSSVEMTDTGTECEPGMAAGVSVDLASKQVTPIELGIEGREGPSRADVFGYGVDGDVAIHVIGDGWKHLVVVHADDTVEPLPEQDGQIYCGTEVGLYGSPPSEEPARPPTPVTGIPPRPARTLPLVELRPDTDAWSVVKPADDVPTDAPACTRQHLLVLDPPGGGVVAIDSDGDVTRLPDAALDYISYFVTDRSSGRFAIRVENHFLLADVADPDHGYEEIEMPEHLEMTMATPVIVEGDLWFIGPSGLVAGA